MNGNSNESREVDEEVWIQHDQGERESRKRRGRKELDRGEERGREDEQEGKRG